MRVSIIFSTRFFFFHLRKRPSENLSVTFKVLSIYYYVCTICRQPSAKGKRGSAHSSIIYGTINIHVQYKVHTRTHVTYTIAVDDFKCVCVCIFTCRLKTQVLCCGSGTSQLLRRRGDKKRISGRKRKKPVCLLEIRYYIGIKKEQKLENNIIIHTLYDKNAKSIRNTMRIVNAT